MAHRYRIEYLPIALRDLLEIFDYISKDNPAAAQEFLNIFEASIGKLARFPFLGKRVTETRIQTKGYRVFIIKDYLTFYVVDKVERVVEVRRILHGSRRYISLLLDD